MIEELEELYNKILEENKNLQDKLRQHPSLNTNTNEYEQKRQALLKTEIEEKLEENSFLKFLSDNEDKSVPYLYELVIDTTLNNLKRLEQKHPFKYSQRKLFIQALNRNKQDFLDYLINTKHVEMFDYYDGNKDGVLLGPRFVHDSLFEISFDHAIAIQDWNLFIYLDKNIKFIKRSDVNYAQNHNSFKNAWTAFIEEKMLKYYSPIAYTTFGVVPEIFDFVYGKMQRYYDNNTTKLEKLFKVSPNMLTALPLAELKNCIDRFNFKNCFDSSNIVRVVNTGDVEKLKFMLEFNKSCSSSYYGEHCALKDSCQEPRHFVINILNLDMIKFISSYMLYDELMELLIRAEKLGEKEIVKYLTTLI